MAEENVVVVRATGSWKESPGEAETDCHEKLDAALAAKTRELKGQGKEVRQGETRPLREEQHPSKPLVRFHGEADLIWSKA